MTADPKIYTAAEVASAGFSQEEIDQAVAKVTQRAYKAAKRGESSITHYGANQYLLDQIAKRLRELGYTAKLSQRSIGSNYITVRWNKKATDSERNQDHEQPDN